MNLLWFRLILRNLKSNKFYSFITIFGLAIGMSATILIFIYIQHELSYDRFNVKARRIYRINSIFKDETSNIWPLCIALRDSAVQKEVPEIEEYLQVYNNSWSGLAELTKDNIRFKNIRLIYTSANFNKVFSVNYIKGDSKKSLLSPHSIVLTKSIAEKLFGSIDIIGKNVLTNYSKEFYTVSGVVEDYPSNSHLEFDAIVPMESIPFNIFHSGLEVYTYVLFREKCSIDEGLRKTRNSYNRILAQHLSERGIMKTDCFLQKLTDIHLKSDFQSKNGSNAAFKKVFIYLSMALVVLLIAIINFINLLTAQYEGKAKQIGVQKAIGASRKNIATSFIVRSIIFSFIALIIALIFVEFLIPSFGSILSRDLINTYRNNITLIAALPLLALFVGLTAGIYPALFISRFSPSLAIKGVGLAINGTNRFTKALVIMQFAISIFLVNCLLVMNKQITFMKNVDLGFDSANVIAITDLNENVGKSYSAIKDALQGIPEIKSIGSSFHLFGTIASGQKIDVLGEKPLKEFPIYEYRVFPGFFETLGFRIIEGRPFDENVLLDKQAVILNETAVKMMGLSNPLNTEIDFFDKMHVIGVVKDFHYYSLVDRIEPMMFTCYSNRLKNIMLKIPRENFQVVLEKVEKIIKKYDPGYVMDYVVIDDFCRNRYGAQEQTETLSTYTTILSLILALLGLYALAMFMVQKRTKEIGIRKVNGATRIQIVNLLLRVYISQVAIAFLIAAPIAYFTLRNWLNDFAYRITLTPLPFIIAGLLALAVAVITVAGQTWKAAGKNPIESLKYE